MQRPIPRVLIAFVLAGGIVAFLVALAGSLVAAVVAGLVTWVIGLIVVWWGTRGDGGAPNPERRRFLTLAGLGGLVWAAGGTAIGRALYLAGRPDAQAAQEEGAQSLGAEYLELVRRDYRPGRSGDLQLLLAPFNSANYPNESISLVPKDPRTSHASVWMYLERIPLVVYAPGRIGHGDSEERVTLADLAPTTAGLIGFADWPSDRDGRMLPGLPLVASARERRDAPKVVVTFVIDGGGWNVLSHWDGRWPNLKRLMHDGMNYRNAITGSYPAVTAAAHATIGTGAFPWKHGITGHNIRDGSWPRKAYREAGKADPGDLLLPTLADLWSESTAYRAWVGEIGYQVWHLGMLGFGGHGRPDKPVGVYWDELEDKFWAPHNPDLFRLPNDVPGIEVYDAKLAAFVAPDWDKQFTPVGRQEACCAPPIVEYQGDLIEATLRSEPIGQTGTSDLLFINYKSPDYTGHIYNMFSEWEGLQLEAVDAELGRLVNLLDELYSGDYVLFVTADHGQCPLPDAVQGVRLDPIQLRDAIEREFGGLYDVVQDVYPSEVYLDPAKLRDAGATVSDVAAFLANYRYRQNIGPYVAQSAIEQDLMDQKEFAAVLSTKWLDQLRNADLSTYGDTTFTDPGVDPGIPPQSLIQSD